MPILHPPADLFLQKNACHGRKFTQKPSIHPIMNDAICPVSSPRILRQFVSKSSLAGILTILPLCQFYSYERYQY
jgi:hypothetical protein